MTLVQRKLCFKCQSELKEVRNLADLMAPPQIYCHNEKCERFGLITAIWICRTVKADGSSVESTQSPGVGAVIG